MKRKRRVGRPNLPKGTRVTDRERLCMYVTPREAKLIEKWAEKSNKSVSNYLR